MKLLFDLFPVILFFISYKLSQGNIFLATAVTIAASVAQIVWLKARRKPVEPMLWFSTALVTVMGSATLYFHNQTFIMWKPTLLYWGFALALLLSQTLWRKNLIRNVLEQQLVLPDAVWLKLNYAWAAFFVVMGALNLLVAYQFSEATWVNFKLFGGMGLMLLFVILQGMALSRYLPDNTDTPPSAE